MTYLKEGYVLKLAQLGPVSNHSEPIIPIELKYQSNSRLRLKVKTLKGRDDLSMHLTAALENRYKGLIFDIRTKTGSLIVTSKAKKSLSDALRVQLTTILCYYLGEMLTDESKLERQGMTSPGKQTNPLSITSNTKVGLSQKEAIKRRHIFGPNTIEHQKSLSPIQILKCQILNPQNYVLLSSGTTSYLLKQIPESFLTFFVTAVNIGIGFHSELKAANIISSLGVIPESDSIIIREGSMKRISSAQLVPGDICIIKQGIVPADIGIIKSSHLVVDESILTGESSQVHKHANNTASRLLNQLPLKPNLYRGSIVTSGSAKGVVLATGKRTKVGQIQTLTETTNLQKAPIRTELDQLNYDFLMLLLGGCTGLFFLGLIRNHSLPKMLKLSATLAVASIPESLPTVATSSLAISAKKLKADGVISRRLEIIDTLACIDTICLDKTGTLTMNRMSAAAVAFNHTIYDINSKSVRSKANKTQLDSIIKTLILCNDSRLKDKNWLGSPTETALIKLAIRLGYNPTAILNEYHKLKVYYRNEKHIYMISKHTHKNEKTKLTRHSIKGDPIQILERCSHSLSSKGKTILSQKDKSTIADLNQHLAEKGMRVLGLACFHLASDELLKNDTPFTWLGLVALKDPLRPEMQKHIKTLQSSGIKTIMLTGDQLHTATSIAKDLNLNPLNPSPKILDASQLKEKDFEIDHNDYDGFARVNPSQKLTIVEHLQRRGHTVAMTGDGINDSPALKAAAVGISMGKNASLSAKESADLILEQDDIEALIRSIIHARQLRKNLKNSIDYMLATNLSELLLVVMNLFIKDNEGLSPSQLLWVNLLTDILPGLALSTTKQHKTVEFSNSKHPQDQILFSREEKKLIFSDALLISLSSFFIVWLARSNKTNIQKESSHTFLTLILNQLLFIFSAAKDHKFLSKNYGPKKAIHPYVLIAFFITIGLLIIGFKSKTLQKLLQSKEPTKKQIFLSVISAILTFITSEYSRRYRTNKKSTITDNYVEAHNA